MTLASRVGLVGLVSLAGCAVHAPVPANTANTDTNTTATIPQGWSVGAGTGTSTGTAALPTPLIDWWTRFQDPVLSALVSRALTAGLDVMTAQAALRQAQALRDASAATLWPTLGLSAAAQHNTSGGTSAGTPVSVSLGAAWSPDFFGQRHSALAASQAAALASAATLGNVQRALAASVVLDYIILRSAEVRLGIAEVNLASQREILQITRWREQAGLVTSLESEQAQSATDQTEALLPALRIVVEQSQHALAVLTGQAPTALAAALAVRGPLPQVADDVAMDIPARVLRQRPDVQAAEWQVQAAWARVAQSRAARAPDLSLSGSIGLSALSLGGLVQGSSVVSALLASVAMPLFDAGALDAQVRAQQAALEQARAAWQAVVLAALKDVEDTLSALQGDRLRIRLLERAAVSASNASLLARQRYSSGLVDFQTVLETQRTQLATQDSLASARADLSADQVRLYVALGGGWQADDRLSSPSTHATSASTPAP